LAEGIRKTQIPAIALARLNTLAWDIAILGARLEPFQEPIMHIAIHIIEKLSG